MKLSICLLVAILPLAMSAGHGDGGIEAMMRQMEQEVERWGMDSGEAGDREKEEDCDKDKEEEMEMRKMMKEMGMEMGEWSDKMKDWLENTRDDHDGNDDHSSDGDDKKVSKEMMKEFRQYLQYRAEAKEAKHKKEERFRHQVYQFNDYLKMKKLQEEERMKMEMRKEQAREYNETAHALRQIYMNATYEHSEARFRFMFGITTQVLDVCQCDDRIRVLMRLRDGDFGNRHMGGGDNGTTGSPSPTHFPSTMLPPWNSSFDPGNSTWSPPDNSTWSPPGGSSWSPPENSTMSPPGSSSWSPPDSSSWSPPGSSSWSPQNNSSWSPPGSSSWSPQNNSTWSPPGSSSWSPQNNSTWSPPSGFPSSTMPPGMNETWPTWEPSSPMPTDNGGHGGDNDGPSPDEIMEVVMRLAYMKPEEQFEFIFNRMMKDLCEVAGVYMDHVSEVEKAVYQYMRMHGSNHVAAH